MHRTGWFTAFLVMLLALPAADDSAAAATLGGRECARFAIEKQLLVAQGVQGHLDRGPVWASANLTPEKIGRVRRLIALTEALEFRCDRDEMRRARARMASGYYRKWEALKPPLPIRNPKFVALRNPATALTAPAAKPVTNPVRTVQTVRNQGGQGGQTALQSPPSAKTGRKLDQGAVAEKKILGPLD